MHERIEVITKFQVPVWLKTGSDQVANFAVNVCIVASSMQQ